MKKKLSSLTALFIFLILWHVFSICLNKQFLPSPLKAFAALLSELQTGKILLHFGISAYRITAALAISFLFAAPCGILLGSCRKADELFSPLVMLLYPVPKAVLLPVIVVLFGLGDFPKILLISLVIFFQLLVVTKDAAAGVPENYLLLARTMGMTRRDLWRHVYIPACVPQMVTALRVSLGTAVAILFFAETFASLTGLGYYISDCMSRRSYDKMYGGIIAMALLGLIFYEILNYIEKRLSSWR